MSDRERVEQAISVALFPDGLAQTQKEAIYRELKSRALLREQAREVELLRSVCARCGSIIEAWHGGVAWCIDCHDDVPTEVRRFRYRPPTSTSEGAEGSFGGVSLLNSLVRLGRGALEMEFGLTENGDVGVWWTRGIEDAPDAVGDTVDEALYRLLAAPPEPESEET